MDKPWHGRNFLICFPWSVIFCMKHDVPVRYVNVHQRHPEPGQLLGMPSYEKIFSCDSWVFHHADDNYTINKIDKDSYYQRVNPHKIP